MDYQRLQYDFRHSPSLRLIRSDHAPLILSFLHSQFKVSQRISFPEEEFLLHLENTLEELNSQHLGGYPKAAEVYLKEWCDPEHRFLRRLSRNNNDLIELTPDTERCLAWLQGFYQTQFVGTESRFLSIFALLSEMVSKSTEDVGERLAQLENEKYAIEAEIERIRIENRVRPYSETQLRERFFQASELTRDLLRDFHAIEQSFKNTARTLQERQMQPSVRKGMLLGEVLADDAELKNSDMGRSFYAFWDFLSSETKREELRTMLETIYALPALQTVVFEQQLLRGMVRHLHQAGEKVVQSNQRLAEQLRRLLDERYLTEKRRVRELIDDLKHLALEPNDLFFLEVDGDAQIDLPLERGLWEAKEVVRLQVRPENATIPDLTDPLFADLHSQFWVNETLLEQQLEVMLLHQDSCTLPEVLTLYPPKHGLAEVLGYMAIASREAKHSLDSNHSSIVTWQIGDTMQQWRVPLLVFRRSK
jgi:hypothetical protein